MRVAVKECGDLKNDGIFDLQAIFLRHGLADAMNFFSGLQISLNGLTLTILHMSNGHGVKAKRHDAHLFRLCIAKGCK